MLVLFETPAGYAVFKVLDEKKLQQCSDLYSEFQTPDDASRMVKLKVFEKFKDTTVALAATTAAIEGKMSKPLKKVLKKIFATEAHEELAVADAKLGNAIKEKLDIQCVYSQSVHELMRGIRAQINSLITGLPSSELNTMALGLSHSLSRYKLKFSPDKVDTMIVQAVSLLDDLDKELNNYVMRCREWYGWHFPELSKIVTDNLVFARTVKSLGVRENAFNSDLSDVLPEHIELQVKAAAEISMGTEISEDDILNIMYLCDQIIELTDYRTQLYDYLKNRMMAIAPNLTVMVGELVGARLIAHAGSLMNLAKQPASTVQILGAEKALFRALKTKSSTPKYGLLYHASIVGQSNAKNKGKMSRTLAAKTAIAIRCDAFAEDDKTEVSMENRAKVEARLRMLEEGKITKISGTGKSTAHQQKYTPSGPTKIHDVSADSTLPSRKRKRSEADTPVKAKIEEIEEPEQTLESPAQEAQETGEQPPTKKSKKDKKKKKRELEESFANGDHKEETESTPVSEKKKKKKSKKTKEESD